MHAVPRARPHPAAIGETLLSTASQPLGTPSDRSKPSECEVAEAAELMRSVVAHTLETKEVAERRTDILQQISDLLQMWAVAELGEAGPEKLRSVERTQARCRLFVYGSYRLSVHLPDGDLDVLAVTPPVCGSPEGTRQSFYSTFSAILREHVRPKPSALHVVADAVVPVIKLRWQGLEIDCAYACADVADAADVTSDDTMNGASDEKTANSLAGVRNNEYVLSCAPNYSVFWVAVRAIKLWARRRFVYSNMYGYLGGGAVAVLVGRICQSAPHRLPAEIVRRFFGQYSKWLSAIHSVETEPEIMSVNPEAAEYWRRQPRSLQLSAVAPNPTKPYTNTMRNVTPQHLRVLWAEMQRADQLLNGGGSVRCTSDVWEQVIRPRDPLQGVDHLLEVEVAATTDQVLREWGGLIASRLRLLPDVLERQHPRLSAALVPVEFTPGSGWIHARVKHETTEEEVGWVWTRDQGKSKRPRVSSLHAVVHYIALQWKNGCAGRAILDSALLDFAASIRANMPTSVEEPRVRLVSKDALDDFAASQIEEAWRIGP